MALITVKSGSPPAIARAFAAATAAVLHDADAPAGCKVLPAGVIFHGAGDFEWVDATGESVLTVVPATAAGLFVPIAPAELEVGNEVAVTVLWHKHGISR